MDDIEKNKDLEHELTQLGEKLILLRDIDSLEINEYNLINIGFTRREDIEVLCYLCQHTGYGNVFKKAYILYIEGRILVELIVEYTNDGGKILHSDCQTNQLYASNINDVLSAIRLFTKPLNK